MLFLLMILCFVTSGFAQVLRPAITPRAIGMGGAIVALPTDPSGIFFNPAGLAAMTVIGTDQSYGTSTGDATDHILISYAAPATDEGSRFGTGFYVDGQTRPAPWKYYVPWSAFTWQPMSRLAIGAVTRFIQEIPRADSLESKWTNSIDIGVLTPGKNLNFGARVEHAFGGTSVVPRTAQWGVAYKSDNQKLNLTYQWDGDLLDGIKYRHTTSRLGMEVVTGPYATARAGYIWSDVHRWTAGLTIGLTEGGMLVHGGWSVPTEKKAPTDWSVGLSYRL